MSKKMYEVPVTILVKADAHQEKNVEKTVLHYLQDFIPDEAPGDSIHLADFKVGKAKEWKK